MEEENPYERERTAIIAANRARLAAMGIVVAAAALAPPPPRPRPAAPAQARPPQKKKRPAAPTRASARLRGGTSTRSSGPVPPSPPRSRSPSPSPPPRKWDPAELAALAAARAAALESRLAELRLAGLIDATGPGSDPAEARFAVVGAPHKGQRQRKHYVISLFRTTGGGDKQAPVVTHTCECMDFRMRRARTGEACKHIALVLAQLGCGGGGAADKARWPECLRAQVMVGGGGGGLVAKQEEGGGSGGGAGADGDARGAPRRKFKARRSWDKGG